MGFFSEKKRKMNRKLGVLVLAMVLMCGAMLGEFLGNKVYAAEIVDLSQGSCIVSSGYAWFEGVCWRGEFTKDQRNGKFSDKEKEQMDKIKAKREKKLPGGTKLSDFKNKTDCNDNSGIWFQGECYSELSEDQKKLKDKIDKCTKAGKTWYEDKCMEKEDARKAIEEKNAKSGDSSSKECPDGVKTAMFGCVKDDGKGEPVFKLLGMVINIMTFGIGSLAVFGIVFSGFQYASARDNEAQVKKAKERITNIVIGLVVYAVAYAVISWLLPGGL